MAIKTTEKTVDRRTRINELREHHKDVLASTGALDEQYVPTIAYRPYGKDGLHVSLFPSHLRKGYDLYLEFVSRDLVPDDANRTLYKWRYNPYWQEEYEAINKDTNADERYLIPVAEMEKVDVSVKEEVAPKQLVFDGFDEIMDPDQDAPLDQITIRDLAAIMLKQPVSKKKWLNDLIK